LRHSRRRHHRLLGRQRGGAGRRAGGHVQGCLCRLGTQLRHCCRRHHRLLGRRTLRRARFAARHLRGRLCRHGPQLCS